MPQVVQKAVLELALVLVLDMVLELVQVQKQLALRGKRLEVAGAPRQTLAHRRAGCAGCWSAWVIGVGEPRGLFPRLCRPDVRGVRSLSESFGNCVLTMLAEGFQSARLETRTKESNMYASWWVATP